MIHKTPEFYKEKVDSLLNLPTLSTIANKIVQVTRNDNKSVNQLLPIIEKDPPFAMKILKLANSAYYGSLDEIKSLKQAVVGIGMKALHQLALSFSVLSVFANMKDEEGLYWSDFWMHSVACAHIAELLNKKLGLAIPGSPYSLGLLHDIGKLVLHRIDPVLYTKAANYAKEKSLTSMESEQEMFGITHEDTGKWIAEKWKLPIEIIQVIGFHHHPSDCDESLQKSTSLIQVADLVCNFNLMNFRSGYVNSIPREESGWLILQLNNKYLEEMDFEHFVMSIQDEVEDIYRQVKLIKP